MYSSVDQVRSVADNSFSTPFLAKILTAERVKKHYIALDFSEVNNPEYYDDQYYSIELATRYKRVGFFSPQLNGITLTMPSSPPIFDWANIDKASQIFNLNITCHLKLNKVLFFLSFVFRISFVTIRIVSRLAQIRAKSSARASIRWSSISEMSLNSLYSTHLLLAIRCICMAGRLPFLG